MLQSHASQQAGELAQRLCELAGGRLTRAYFASSGSEGVDSAIKFARAFTGRPGILYAAGGFHGLTCSTLSLMSNPFWKQNFGPFLPETEAVALGQLDQLAQKLATRHFAGFILEPVQAESGIVVPTREYLQQAQALCRKYGTLLVLDEVQTGMHRCGPFLAAHHFGLDPDLVILAKAMSGGLVPSAAVLMSDAVCNSIYSSLRRAVIHTSTYSENGLAMRAGLATLDVLQEERLGERSARVGEALRRRLADKLSGFEMVGEIRGLGLLCGIEFRTPKSLRLRIPFEAFAKIHAAMFGQVLVMRMFRDHGILSQICGNNFMVLKVAPPLVVEEAQLEHFVSAIAQVVELMHTSAVFWTEALGMARRVINSI
jgi:ornithine--oxo-acid transaminase